MEKKIDNLRGRIEELDSGELATTVAQLKSAGEMIQTIGALEMRVNSAEIEQGSLQKQVAEIEARIEVLDGGHRRRLRENRPKSRKTNFVLGLTSYRTRRPPPKTSAKDP